MFSIMFNIFNVALMAAPHWSTSNPRVLKSFPLKFQVMVVCTNASVRPPAGMKTT